MNGTDRQGEGPQHVCVCMVRGHGRGVLERRVIGRGVPGRRARARRRAGVGRAFTLIELLVVIAIIAVLIGLLVAFAGWGLLSGRTWARAVAITLAVLSAIANFAFIPYYPFWSLLIITLDIFVIWAVAAHGGALREPV